MRIYRTTKNTQGNWKTEENKDIGDKRRLKLYTTKDSSGRLVTRATVAIVNGMWETHKLYEDFSETLEVTHPKRITSGICETQHLNHDIELIAKRVINFYREKEDAKSR